MKRKSIQQTYEVYVYKPHKSGIGSTYVKTIYVNEKPSFDNGYWLDETNKKWAIWEKDIYSDYKKTMIENGIHFK